MGDKYDDMTGPTLSEELAIRGLPVSGKVDELRERLRENDAQKAEDASNPADEGDDTPYAENEAEEDAQPERDPEHYEPMSLVLNEDQARALTAGEAKMAQFLRHVMPFSQRKYVAGDRVFGVVVREINACRVLPFGIEVPLDESETQED